MGVARRSNPELARGEVRQLGPSLGDPELVRRACAGDAWAEEALYRRHVRRVSDAAARVLGRSAEAEDVVQETFLKCFHKLTTLRDPTLFDRWLMRIAMNKVRGRLRKRRLLRSLGLDQSADDATLERFAAKTTPPDVRAQLAQIDAALGEVAANHRMAWVLHVIEGMSLPETADACECSLATCKRWIRATRLHIEAHVRDEEDEA